MGKKTELSDFHKRAGDLLHASWADVIETSDLEQSENAQWSDLAAQIIRDGGSTYPYILITQTLGKCTNPELNALCLQDSSRLPGAWDARSLASKIVAPWNDKVGRPLSGANPDPYVNNPARYKNFGEEMRSKAKNKPHYDALEKIADRLQAIEHNEQLNLLKIILIEVKRHLEAHQSDYFGPPRASVNDVMSVIEQFLAVPSNGVRLQVVIYALFKVISASFTDFGHVRSYPTNSADKAGGRAGDVERLNQVGEVDFAIEVKDRTLSLAELDNTILKARAAKIFNVLFVVQGNPLTEDPEKIQARITHEFSRGIDINVAASSIFVNNSLILLTPQQRSHLLRVVHDSLHEMGAHFKHRQHWQELMRSL